MERGRGVVENPRETKFLQCGLLLIAFITVAVGQKSRRVYLIPALTKTNEKSNENTNEMECRLSRWAL